MTTRPHLRPVMLAGTGSDVGKSVISTALCRIFRQDGYDPAPFKAQNMALNSAVTPEGLEIGRAQAVQAEAAGVPCHTDMNPVLLKPSSDSTSQVVVNGRAVGNRSAWEFFRGEGKALLRAEAHAAFDRLAARHNPVVMEGAGSVAEINLRDGDIVNMSMARHADAAVVLVADIDRGGVFASVYGSIMLQSEEDRARIKGVIVNKFRGDMRLFDEGRRMMEELCGVPVLGVVPMLENVGIEAEDSVALAAKPTHAVGTDDPRVNVAVVRTGHISNFTDFDALERDPRAHLYYTDDPREIARAAVVILPGSKSTVADLADLRARGVDCAVIQAYAAGATVLGICGGYQMMGREVRDPDRVEGGAEHAAGLDLLPVTTVIRGDKVTRRRTFHLSGDGRECAGYEIHMGRTEVVGTGRVADSAELAGVEYPPFATLDDGTAEGCRAGRAMGTYLHGCLDNAAVRDMLLAPLWGGTSGNASDDVSGGTSGDASCGADDHEAFKQRQYDHLADHVRRHVDIARLYEILAQP